MRMSDDDDDDDDDGDEDGSLIVITMMKTRSRIIRQLCRRKEEGKIQEDVSAMSLLCWTMWINS